MLHLHYTPTPLELTRLTTAQVAYALLTIQIDTQLAAPTTAPDACAWVFLVDASHSMQIPIVTDAVFRELARSGTVHETLVDGVAVWQFSGAVPEHIRAASPTALRYVYDALHSIVEHLRGQDQFALVACAERAELLVPLHTGREREQLLAQLDALNTTELGDATELAAGLQLALTHLQRVAGPFARRIVLLTDGFTQDAAACLALAQRAAQEQVAVSTLGLGGDFQEELLTALADSSGGRATMVRDAEQIGAAVAAEFAAARFALAPTVRLMLHLSQGVQVRHITRIAPELTLLTPQHSSDGRHVVVAAGDVGQDGRLTLLLELLVPPAPRAAPAEQRRVRLAQVRVQGAGNLAPASADLIASYAAHAAPLVPPVQAAVAQASTARLLQRALTLARQGKAGEAGSLLHTAATRLREQGKHTLADTVQREAATLLQTGKTTRLGAKELAYATRRLGGG
ncbi:MAG: VWA domain-containing protein [Cyanobacteria bacterium M5B4]|nr:MAG: VWA domain-containing protein [Cyanobacteria bacterium M5B4]